MGGLDLILDFFSTHKSPNPQAFSPILIRGDTVRLNPFLRSRLISLIEASVHPLTISETTHLRILLRSRLIVLLFLLWNPSFVLGSEARE